jgi:hypothetical protein
MGKMINAHRQKPQESNHLEDLGVERNTKINKLLENLM